MTQRPGWPTVFLLFVARHPVWSVLVVLAGWLGVRFGWDGLLLPAIGVLVQVGLSLMQQASGAPGRVLSPAAQPHLTGLVQRVAEQVGFQEPILVSLTPMPDAALGRVRVQGARVVSMVLGLPFLRTMTEAELASVVAHELGHLRDLDDKRSARVLRARDQLAERVTTGAWLPRLLGSWLLRRTQPLSFARELAADADAARVAGTAATASALRATEVQYEVFHGLVSHWFEELGEKGRYPSDAYEALDVAVRDPLVRARALEDPEPVEDWDSHPAIAERVRVLPDAPGTGFADHPVQLLDADELQRWCIRQLVPSDEQRPIRLLDDPLVIAPTGDEARADIERLASSPAELIGWVADGTWRSRVPFDEPEVLVGLLGQLLSVELMARGWTPVSPWIFSRLADPSGATEVELRDVLRSALAEDGDAGPLVEVAAAAGLA